LFALLRILSERDIAMQKDIYVCFVNYIEAFDNLCALILSETLALYKSFTYLLTYRHERLFQDLEEILLDTNDLRMLSEL